MKNNRRFLFMTCMEAVVFYIVASGNWKNQNEKNLIRWMDEKRRLLKGGYYIRSYMVGNCIKCI